MMEGTIIAKFPSSHDFFLEKKKKKTSLASLHIQLSIHDGLDGQPDRFSFFFFSLL